MAGLKPADGYTNFHHKMTFYIAKIAGQAQAIDPKAKAEAFRPHAPDDNDSVFLYEDTASRGPTTKGSDGIGALIRVPT